MPYACLLLYSVFSIHKMPRKNAETEKKKELERSVLRGLSGVGKKGAKPPTRPPTAWSAFLVEQMKSLPPEDRKKKKQKGVSKRISAQWANMSDEEKRPWTSQAENAWAKYREQQQQWEKDHAPPSDEDASEGEGKGRTSQKWSEKEDKLLIEWLTDHNWTADADDWEILVHLLPGRTSHAISARGRKHIAGHKKSLKTAKNNVDTAQPEPASPTE
eukprot:TRINITY_DN63655_c0_g1_i1.p1 TRINITY_DN63655_c0_g1~~TRINITY_DN63655_c0_g1_i1.p1  ORF type:complete len:216 (-),score=38.03 TRINITY_DN63655_c0_g1_i1:736-1383(-)